MIGDLITDIMLQPQMVEQGYLTTEEVQKTIRPVLLNRLLTGEFDPPEMVR